MKPYLKAVLSILCLCISFILMVENEYVCCLGSLLLPIFKLPHWSAGTTGMHMPILYFGIPFLFSFKLIHDQVIKPFNLKKRWILLMVVLTISGMSEFANQGIAIAKGHSPELLAIAYNPIADNLKYTTKNNDIETLEAQITLRNFSDKDLSFTMALDSSYYQEKGVHPIQILDASGQLYPFKIEAGAIKTFHIDNTRMRFSGGSLSENGTSTSRCKAILLTSESTGQKVRLVWNGFWGTIE